MRHGEAAFVDSGAWIALALSRDPLHPPAREQWDALLMRTPRLTDR
jgi:predicted nucleic acid-binding protein